MRRPAHRVCFDAGWQDRPRATKARPYAIAHPRCRLAAKSRPSPLTGGSRRGMAFCGTWRQTSSGLGRATTIVALMRCLACVFGFTPRRKRMSKAFIGTSGWTHDGWRGRFYLEDLRKRDWVAWYANQFPTTEINGSFYRTPSLDAVRTWRDQTPRDFLFAWKASKFITHWKWLGEACANSIELMEKRLTALSPKIVAVLFQLPPQFSKNRDRLASFLNMLPRGYRFAFEFRHKSWYDDEIFNLLHQ